jgi:hypothetical protein
MDFPDRRGWVLLTIEAIVLNIVADGAYDGLKRAGFVPDVVRDNGQFVFLGVLLVALSFLYWWMGRPLSPRNADARLVNDVTIQEHAETETKLREILASRDSQIIALQKDADAYRQEVTVVSAQLQESNVERDALVKRLETTRRDREIAAVRNRETRQEIEQDRDRLSVDFSNLKMRADGQAAWVKELLERHAGMAIEYQRIELWHLDGLNGDEPYVDFGIQFRYSGILRLVIAAFRGEIGRISLDGET